MAATDYDFELNRNQIIESAFRKVGQLTEGETLSAFQIKQGKDEINTLLKSWQTEDIWLWTYTTGSFSTIVDQANYDLGDDPTITALDKAYEATSATTDIPLEIITYRDYQDLRNKGASGTAIFAALTYDEQQPEVYIWPVPTSIYTVKYVAVRRLKDMDAGSDKPDIPQRFQQALIYGLAANLADDAGLPIQERKYLKGVAEQKLMKAKASDREMSDYDGVDGAFRYGRNQRRFK